MEGLFFNVNGGYIEGLVRGYRNSLLTSQHYGNLTQCDTIDDVKIQLGPAYGDFLAALPPNPSTSALAGKTTEKLVAEFRYIQAQATGSIARFMEYLTYGYMIDNIALLITGTLHERDTRELLERCHPLGWFETMPVLCVATNIEELYNSVLVETPLAPYFKGSISHQDLDELNIEIVRNMLYKNYLEDFYRFVNSEPGLKGSPTSEVMSEALEFEADRRAINITLNSFGTELSKAERKKLYPEFGKLYPEGTLMLSRADDVEGVALAVSGVGDYKAFFDAVGLSQGGAGGAGGAGGIGGAGLGNMAGGGSSDGRSLEDMFYQKEMEISKLTFTRQFTPAIIYAWVKLREQEIRNITWIAECIAQNQKERIGNYISVF
ncbi:vacuolar ATP synthase subunit D [Histoplasma capsulatum G186AR]|uniref:V-type proton ATPase subunit n=1 Tax=Ajellomyces capsulatus TaxID=5037 RepID=A0A8H7Z0D6_AJECA|nr:vacuolar ATP synthase subunit D [Histoplasma capsulatum]QSS73118.1 vacuolar ATP synthase subunit D [Histoplasma capsulatum G186AR]